MEKVKDLASLWVIGRIVSLYTTFVLQSLWNWFVVSIFHLAPIHYWEMFALLLLVGLLTERLESEDPGGRSFGRS